MMWVSKWYAKTPGGRNSGGFLCHLGRAAYTWGWLPLIFHYPTICKYSRQLLSTKVRDRTSHLTYFDLKNRVNDWHEVNSQRIYDMDELDLTQKERKTRTRFWKIAFLVYICYNASRQWNKYLHIQRKPQRVAFSGVFYSVKWFNLLGWLPYPMRRKTPCFSYGDIRRVHRIYASNWRWTKQWLY